MVDAYCTESTATIDVFLHRIEECLEQSKNLDFKLKKKEDALKSVKRDLNEMENR